MKIVLVAWALAASTTRTTMIRMKGALKHRCTCGTIYEPKNRQDTRCPDCVDKPAPITKPEKSQKLRQYESFKSCTDEVKNIMMFGSVEDLLNEPIRPNQYDLEGGF